MNEKGQFEVGDVVECVDFSGATGALFMRGKFYDVSSTDYSGNSPYIFVGNNPDHDPSKAAYATRFRLIEDVRIHNRMPEPEMELDEIHAAQELMK